MKYYKNLKPENQKQPVDEHNALVVWSQWHLPKLQHPVCVQLPNKFPVGTIAQSFQSRTVSKYNHSLSKRWYKTEGLHLLNFFFFGGEERMGRWELEI